MNLGRYILGITGASGSIYGIRLAQQLLVRGDEIHLVMTDNGRAVVEYETGYTADELTDDLQGYDGKLESYSIGDIFAPISSGSFKADAMIVAPCSMATLAHIANGISDNLLERAADVCIKERRRLILVPRETPLSSIHLSNMLALSQAGAIVLPAMPAFYHKPQSLDDAVNFVVGKTLDALGIDNDLYKHWNGEIKL
ncbi:UbiX family flavin prenyltransferase [Mahella australiensis]|uniref:Flavin prenyltransferase UbiX n=1 Tax=Mahella australiensis (strain DSM 15567 / CIP 107919 / 50-1 BON) TaxID=697281 RepID=F4A3F2_MAHA5|nr:flavin prenyltransferase UbiX [Mahella australiensis]AEE97407.1 3-octaprenyl-4-hydroxybenzoate carboxy-lyase [Mahella australiensis 50-1 BON]